MKINNKNKIIKYFESGIKETESIGVENEKFLFFKNTKKRADFEIITNLLEKFHQKFNWEKVNEGKNLIGLKSNGQSISLEPGNQLELAGDKLNNIHEVCAESYNFQDQLTTICKELNLESISVGYDPLTKLSEVPNNPKERYKIMTEEMPKNGKLSLDMMYHTCGTQINLDYQSEKDFSKKFKLATFLTPLFIGIFANSAVKESLASGYFSYRSYVWQKTSRGGLPSIFFEDMNFEKYADYTMSTPMLFIFDNNKHISIKNKTFSDFMNGKIDEVKNNLPEEKDLELHLSTIFTETRLKKYIEIRSLDACEWDCHCAGPAFLTGLIYGNLDQSIDIIKNWSTDDVKNAYLDAPVKGLDTQINNKSILDWGKIFLDISNTGLKLRNINNSKNKDETIFLKNVENILNSNKTKAQGELRKVLKNV
tara:strand:- start:19 stop:1290 length:1272 start_codon:yes stop_codon:yes gene_type:complete